VKEIQQVQTELCQPQIVEEVEYCPHCDHSMRVENGRWYCVVHGYFHRANVTGEPRRL
jgi:hypothetical protein